MKTSSPSPTELSRSKSKRHPEAPLSRGAGAQRLRGCGRQQREAEIQCESVAHLTVGADAHIGPAECTDFTGISGEVVTSQRADVGIDPYNPVNRIATEIEAAFISSEKPYDSKNAAAVKMTDS